MQLLCCNADSESKRMTQTIFKYLYYKESNRSFFLREYIE